MRSGNEHIIHCIEVKRLFLFLFLLCSISFSFAQHFNSRQYSVQDGLAQSQVYALVQDSRGYMWMGTQGGGLSVFDGLNFKTFNENNGLIDNFINCLLVGADDRLYIGSNQGLCVYDGRSFLPIQIGALKKITVNCLLPVGTTGLYIGTNDGLFQYLFGDKQAVKISRMESRNINALATNTDGNLYAGTDEGIAIFIDGNINWLTKNQGLESNVIGCLASAPDGGMWISPYGKGIQLYSGDTIMNIPALKNLVVYDIAFTEDGLVWLGTLQKGPVCFDLLSRKIKQSFFPGQVSSSQVREICLDDWGNIWMGTSGKGVIKYSGQQFRHYNQQTGLNGNQVRSVAQLASGDIVVGMDEKGLWNMKLGQGIFQKDTRIPDYQVSSVLETSNSDLWVATNGSGIYVVKPDTVIHLDMASGLSSDFVSALAVDSIGHIYAATMGGGICKIHGNGPEYNVDILNLYNVVPDNRITDLAIDSLNRVWYSTVSAGVGVVLDEGMILNFTTDHGLGSNQIRSIALDSKGWIWFGSYFDGISRMDLKSDTLRLQTFEDSHLKSHNIYFLQFDSNDNLWLGTESGLDQVKFDGARNLLEVEHFGRAEGFAGIEAVSNASLLSHDGDLWFGTINGLYQTSNTGWAAQAAPPRVHINRVNLFYQPLEQTALADFVGNWGGIDRELVLTHDQNHLGFEFRGVDLSSPEQLQYRWRLQGNENDWSPLSGRTLASYSNLPPGSYIFEVQSCLKGDLCSTESAKVNLRILAPFWQKSWFLWACVITGFVFISLLFLVILKRVKRQARRNNERLMLEKSVVELEQKALRLQMNPHFIFNTLNSIQGLMATKDTKTSRLYLSKFSKLMRETLENSREALVSVEEEISSLTHYLDLEKFSHEGIFDYKFEIDEGAEEYMIPPLIVQPFAENAIIHGLIPKGGEGLLVIRFSSRGDYLLIEVEDNGVGRKKSAAIKSQKANYHKSTGLQVTQERLDLLNGRRGSGIEFVDKEENGRSSGTIVMIRVYHA